MCRPTTRLLHRNRTRRVLHGGEDRSVSPRPVEDLRGNVIVVWDRGNNHKGPIIREFLRKNRRLHLEMLPPWAPDHNPMEDVWSWLKYGELANFTPADIPKLDETVIGRLVQLKFDTELLRALWNRCKLPFPSKTNQ